MLDPLNAPPADDASRGPRNPGKPKPNQTMPPPQGQPVPQPPTPPQGRAKPNGPGNMPPPIRAPQNPGYGPQSPSVPQIAAPPAPSFGGPGSEILPPAITPERANAGRMDVEAFRPFADSVYSEATRQLDPMMQQREADFRQRMINQGLQEGTEAYDKAFANFSRERNDAYGSARNQALAQALGAQNQFFGQSATNA